MALPPALFSRLNLALAASVLAMLAAGGAHAQMVGGTGFQSVPGGASATAVAARPSSTYSNPYTNNGVAGQAGSGTVGDPTTAAPYAMYATPLPPTPSTMPVSGAQVAPGVYGAEGQPTAPPNYSIQSAPVTGPYAVQPGAPQYAQPYPPQYAQPYAPQYAPPPQYGQPQYPQPQYAPQPQPAQPQYGQPAIASQALSPAFNQIPSPYAAARAAAMSAPQGAPPPMEGGYTLGPGDKVRVTVFGEQDISGEYQLDGNGNIRVPLAGVVHAGGYTAQGLEGWLYAALVPNYLRNPRINVEIMTYRPIYVVGQVQKPGQYAYVNDLTMLNAIGMAGGFTQQAKESTVYVRHEGEAREETVPTAQPLLIRPGDTIRVDTTMFWDAMNLFSPLSGPAYLAK